MQNAPAQKCIQTQVLPPCPSQNTHTHTHTSAHRPRKRRPVPPRHPIHTPPPPLYSPASAPSTHTETRAHTHTRTHTLHRRCARETGQDLGLLYPTYLLSSITRDRRGRSQHPRFYPPWHPLAGEGGRQARRAAAPVAQRPAVRLDHQNCQLVVRLRHQPLPPRLSYGRGSQRPTASG